MEGGECVITTLPPLVTVAVVVMDSYLWSGRMKNYARIINNVAVDVTGDPESRFHPDIVAEFVEVPAEVKQGWVYEIDTDQWAAPPEVPPVEFEVKYPILSPLDFKMCLTVAERLGATELAKTDAVLGDFFAIIEDPRLTEVDLNLDSVRDAVAYFFEKLTENGTVPEADKATRVAQVLSGKRL